MLRTFIDPNGNVQYINSSLLNTNQLNMFDPFSNSSLFFTQNNQDNEDNKDDYNTFLAFPRPIFYTNSNSYNVNNDPELRRRIVRYFFEKYSTTWLPFSFSKLQRYLVSSTNGIEFIKNINEYDNEITSNISSEKIDFIIKNVFGKHEILVFLDKFVRMNNLNWYDLKTKHSDKIKNDLYNKIKNHMKKIVIEHL
jgi:hypothetical protein